MISDFFKTTINTHKIHVKLEKMFQEFDKLIRLYLTVPITTATAERAFST